MKKIREVVEIKLAVLESFPPKLQITASGTVHTGGWSNPELTSFINIQSPSDGIYDFDFRADPPEGFAADVISPIHADYVWDNFPKKLKGVRVNTSQNSQTALLDNSARRDRQPNRFTLKGCDDHTHIVFFPKIFMPLGTGKSPADSQLEYDGAEGHLIFRGEDVSQEETILGSIIPGE